MSVSCNLWLWDNFTWDIYQIDKRRKSNVLLYTKNNIVEMWKRSMSLLYVQSHMNICMRLVEHYKVGWSWRKVYKKREKALTFKMKFLTICVSFQTFSCLNKLFQLWLFNIQLTKHFLKLRKILLLTVSHSQIRTTKFFVSSFMAEYRRF